MCATHGEYLGSENQLWGLVVETTSLTQLNKDCLSQFTPHIEGT